MNHGWIGSKAVRLLALAGGLALVATGCGTRPAATGSNAMGYDQGEAGSSCANSPWSTATPTEVATPIPGDFVAVAATRCRYTTLAVPGDGEYLFRLEERADGGLTDLVQQLRQPSETVPKGIACDLVLLPRVVITLLDAAGTAVVPTVPQTSCGAALPAVLTAIQRLSWQSVRRVQLQQTRTELETSSGCGSGYKPVIDLEAAEGTGKASGPASTYLTPPTQLRVCHYGLHPTATIDAGGQIFKLGTLTGAATMTGAPLTAFLTAIAAATPVTEPCTAPQAPFAEVSDVDGKGPTLIVEIGGCHRFEDGLGHLYQLDPSITLP